MLEIQDNAILYLIKECLLYKYFIQLSENVSINITYNRVMRSSSNLVCQSEEMPSCDRIALQVIFTAFNLIRLIVSNYR